MVGVANNEKRFRRHTVQEHEFHDLQTDECLAGPWRALNQAELVAERTPDGFELSFVQNRIFAWRPSVQRILRLQPISNQLSSDQKPLLTTGETLTLMDFGSLIIGARSTVAKRVMSNGGSMSLSAKTRFRVKGISVIV